MSLVGGATDWRPSPAVRRLGGESGPPIPPLRCAWSRPSSDATGFTACPDPSGANVKAVVRDYASYSFHDISSIGIDVTYPDSALLGNTSPGRVQVAVTYNFIPYTAFPFHPRLKATAQGRIAN